MMKRRDLLRLLAMTGVTSSCGCSNPLFRYFDDLTDQNQDKGGQDLGEVNAPAPKTKKKVSAEEINEELLKDIKARSIHFAEDFPDDIWFKGEKFATLESVTKKLRAVQRHVGYGNFNVLGMDEFFRYAQYANGSSELTPKEKQFVEEIFFFDAKKYGFMGDKVIKNLTHAIDPNKVVKIPYSGHYLEKGESLELYQKLVSQVGDSVILTSGVRALAKQFHLFFEKALETKGNISKASRSLAPPGYSFHGSGDFDIGKRNFGLRNFTEEFAKTDEYKKLLDLGFVQIRYTEANRLGVRFEPWHIKAHSKG